MHEFEYRVRHGQFSPKLLRPVHPIHADLADNISYKLLTVVVLGPATALLWAAFEPRLTLEPGAVALFVPALLLAFWSRFLFGWALACAAFWVTRVGAINQVYFLALMFLSGHMVPIGLLPEALQLASWLLPFRWGVAFPTELLMGRLSPEEIRIGFAMQLLWAVVIWAGWRVVWARAARQYTAVGA